MRKHKALPGHEGVGVKAEQFGWGYLIAYVGPSLAALLDAGCITATIMDRMQNPSTGRTRLDDEGDRFCRRKCPRKGQPERLEVFRYIHTDRSESGEKKALALPGVADYLKEAEQDAEKSPDAMRLMRCGCGGDIDKRTAFLLGYTGQKQVSNRDRRVGRYRRHVLWNAIGSVLVVDWQKLMVERLVASIR